MSPLFWIYVVIAAALTLVTWGVWRFFNRRVAKQSDAESVKTALTGNTFY